MTTNFLAVLPEHVYVTDKVDISRTILQATVKADISDQDLFDKAVKQYSFVRQRMRSINLQAAKEYLALIDAAMTLLKAMDWRKGKVQLVYNEQHASYGPQVDIVAAFYNLAVAAIQETQRLPSPKEKSIKLGVAVYYIEQAIEHAKRYSIDSGMLCLPFLSFIYQFYQAQMYECGAALIWSTQEEKKQTDPSFDDFAAWSRFVASALKYYSACAKVEDSFTFVLKNGYIKRYQISKQRVQQLMQLLYQQSAYYQTRLTNHKAAKADALYCQKLGGAINLGDFFDDPADSPTIYQPYEFNLPAKYAQWGCVVMPGKTVGVITAQQLLAVEEVQGYLASRLEQRKLAENGLSDFQKAAQFAEQLNALEATCKDAGQASVQLRQLLSKDGFVQSVRRFCSEKAQQDALQLCNKCSNSKCMYENLLSTDKENQQKCGALWNSVDFCAKISEYIRSLQSVLEVYQQMPVCVAFLRSLDVAELERLLTRAGAMELALGTEQYLQQIQRLRERLTVSGMDSNQMPDKYWISEHAALPLEKANAKRIAEQLFEELFGDQAPASAAVEKQESVFDVVERELNQLRDVVNHRVLSLTPAQRQLCSQAINALPTIESLERFMRDSQTLAEKHEVVCRRTFEDYRQQLQDKFYLIKEGKQLVISVSDD